MSELLKYKLGNVGYERFISDVRQLGGFLMVFGVCVMTLPQARLAMLIGHDSNPTPQDNLQGIFEIIGGLCEVLVGVVSLWVGYIATGHDYASKWLTRCLVGVSTMLVIPLVTQLADVVKKTALGPTSSPFFANPSYDPTSVDIRFVGSMGFIGVVGWYGAVIASLAFCQRALLVFATGKPELRSRGFYQTRLVFFSILMLIAGTSQLFLGVYLFMQYGGGAMPYGAVRVAMYVIHFPEIAIAVGGFQSLTAVIGLLRAAGKFVHPKNFMFQFAVGLSWIGTLVGTTMIQIYYSGPRMVDATRAPTMVVLTLGLHILPSFLDYKMRNLPFTYPEDFYDPPMRHGTDDDSNNKLENKNDTDESETDEDFTDEEDGTAKGISQSRSSDSSANEDVNNPSSNDGYDALCSNDISPDHAEVTFV